MLRVVKSSGSESDYGHSQVRQGIAGNTKGTAFVVYEDVMDAKQACDKLNGFNFQNRYLVGTSGVCTPVWCPWLTLAFPWVYSTLSPARKDGKIKRGLGGTTRESREA